jgi:hypothetical protein
LAVIPSPPSFVHGGIISGPFDKKIWVIGEFQQSELEAFAINFGTHVSELKLKFADCLLRWLFNHVVQANNATKFNSTNWLL